MPSDELGRRRLDLTFADVDDFGDYVGYLDEVKADHDFGNASLNLAKEIKDELQQDFVLNFPLGEIVYELNENELLKDINFNEHYIQFVNKA